MHATHLTRDDIDAIGAAPVFRRHLPDNGGRPGGRPWTGRIAGPAGARSDPRRRPACDRRPLRAGARDSSTANGSPPGSAGCSPPRDCWTWRRGESHAAIGSPGGRLAVGAPADLVAIRTDSARTAGADPGQLVMSASAADVQTVVIGGVVRARDGEPCDVRGSGSAAGRRDRAGLAVTEAGPNPRKGAG